MLTVQAVMRWLEDGPVAGKRAIIRRGPFYRYEVATADKAARSMVATDDPFVAADWWLRFEGGEPLLPYTLQVGGMRLAE